MRRMLLSIRDRAENHPTAGDRVIGITAAGVYVAGNVGGPADSATLHGDDTETAEQP
jgi:hypothetical protein